MPWVSYNYIAGLFDLTSDPDAMSILTLPILWWASVTLIFLGPYDALLSSALSGFKDGLSDFATA